MHSLLAGVLTNFKVSQLLVQFASLCKRISLTKRGAFMLSQIWFPRVLQPLLNLPWMLLPDAILLQHHIRNLPRPDLHPLVCPVSGYLFVVFGFQKTLPVSSYRLGAPLLRNNTARTSNSGWSFVVNNDLLTIHPRWSKHWIS